MKCTPIGWVMALLLCAAGASIPFSAQAQSNTLSVTLSLASLPQTITLCRDATAIQAFGVDEQWQAGIDVDANSATPVGSLQGIETILVAQTLSQNYPCAPTSAGTQASVVAGLFVWDSIQNNYVQSSVPVNLSFDFTAHTITMTAPLTGPLANLNGTAPIYALTQGSYTDPNGTNPTSAYDNGNAFTSLSGMTDPAGDVLQCSSPCGALTTWYGLIDLVGASATTTQPLQAFGADTLSFEFDLASLQSTVDLCRYPQAIAESAGSDSYWIAVADVDNNPGTGDASGLDAVIQIATTAQPAGCAPHSAPLGQSLSANLGRFDSTSQNWVTVSSLPVTTDIINGKIIVQADRRIAPLAGISAQSIIGMQTAGVYRPAQFPPAYDASGAFRLGQSFSDQLNDVQECTSPCSTSASWYPQIDLIGGSLLQPNDIFNNGFE